MDLLSALAAAGVFSIACNVDTVLLAMGYAIRGVRVPLRGTVVLALFTTLVTYFSLVLGNAGAAVLSPGAARWLGGVVLVAIGAWFCLDYLRHPAQNGETPADLPASGAGWVTLSAALAVNNAGAGLAAGAGGLNAPAAAVFCLFCTLLALPLGRWLGCRLAGRLLGRYALPLSGLLLAALGAWACLG